MLALHCCAPQTHDSTARRVRIQETMEAKPDLGLDFLDYLLVNPPTRDAVVNVAQRKLKPLVKALDSYKVQLHTVSEPWSCLAKCYSVQLEKIDGSHNCALASTLSLFFSVLS